MILIENIMGCALWFSTVISFRAQPALLRS
ncbi:MAG: hypothetical protein ACJA1T_000179, partial [Zhongshania aliphaticivorans]